MWLAIDMTDGTESLWFYWPMLGTGLAVAVTAIVLVGIGGLFGADWENRKVERYLTSTEAGTVSGNHADDAPGAGAWETPGRWRSRLSGNRGHAPEARAGPGPPTGRRRLAK
jgi:2TM domain